MSVYTAPNNRKVQAIDLDRYNDQVILYGTDESFLVPNGIFFIEYLEADKLGTVTIKDGDGTTIASGISTFNQDRSPIRCDYGVQVVGDLAILKGFVLRNVFEE